MSRVIKIELQDGTDEAFAHLFNIPATVWTQDEVPAEIPNPELTGFTEKKIAAYIDEVRANAMKTMAVEEAVEQVKVVTESPEFKTKPITDEDPKDTGIK